VRIGLGEPRNLLEQPRDPPGRERPGAQALFAEARIFRYIVIFLSSPVRPRAITRLRHRDGAARIGPEVFPFHRLRRDAVADPHRLLERDDEAAHEAAHPVLRAEADADTERAGELAVCLVRAPRFPAAPHEPCQNNARRRACPW
jgi:hypothetical protein